MDPLKKQLAEAQAALGALKMELSQTQQGMVALALELEQRVDERTASLRQSNLNLQAEILVRKEADEALRRSQEQLATANENLESLVAERTVRLRDSIAELEHFSYTITHDMRAPLRAMRGYAQILQTEACELTPEHRLYLEKTTAATQRMEGLIDDALNYSRMAREGLPLEPVDAEGLLREIISASPDLQPPRASIRIMHPVPLLLGNRAGLAQCFSNFLNNAVKFVTPSKGPEVYVWAEENVRGIRLWFEDNGIGIPLEQQNRLFQMFERLSNDYEGTGIGLALVKKATERMQGRVGVESEPGKGSRFWMELNKVVSNGHK